MAISLLSVLVGVGLTVYFSDRQQVRQQAGLDDYQAEYDRVEPALRLETPSGPIDTVERPYAYSEVLTLAQVNGADSTRISGPVPIGDGALGEEGTQPLVFREVVFTLVGNHYKPVRITSMKARIVSRSDPPSGTLVQEGPEGASANAKVAFDLDSGNLNARTLPEEDPVLVSSVSEDEYLVDNQVELSRNESVTFVAAVFTRTCLCTFAIDVATNDGKSLPVDSNGQPWQVSAYARFYNAAYAYRVDGSLPQAIPCSWPVECLRY